MASNIFCRWRIKRQQKIGSSFFMVRRRPPCFHGGCWSPWTTTAHHRTITSLNQPHSTPHTVRRRCLVGTFSVVDTALNRAGAGQPRKPRRLLLSPPPDPQLQSTRRQLSSASSSTIDHNLETATNTEEDLKSSKNDDDDDDDDDDGDGDEEEEEETDSQRAAKKLRRKRIAKGRKQLRELQQAEAESGQETGKDSSTTEPVPLRPNIETMSSENFASFYDETVSKFNAAEVKDVVQNLAKVTSGKQAPTSKKGSRQKTKTKPDAVASLPTITILTGMLRETKSAKASCNNNNLQMKVLEFLLSATTTTTTREDDDGSAHLSSSSDKPRQEMEPASDDNNDELRAKFVGVMRDLQKLALSERAAAEKDSSSKGELEEDSNDSTEEGVGEKIDDMFSQAKKPKPAKKKRSQRRYNFVFEALPLFVNTTTLPKERKDPAPSTIAGLQATDVPDRVVFVDNLPIDITVEELNRLYGRFGELASVRIFNQRLDLDPGPLNKQEKEARLKKQLRYAKFDNSRWQRPCSPVYAQMTYADEKGCQEALDEALRIFGMIIHRHPARSIRSADMTRLYIEDIPDEHTCVDVEYELSRLLDPDLYICLGEGQNNRAIVGSCEIRFSSFEWAFHAFQKLETLNAVQDEGNDCRVNWLRTPDGASKWWTRKVGFN